MADSNIDRIGEISSRGKRNGSENACEVGNDFVTEEAFSSRWSQW